MDENKLKALTAELAKGLKTKADLNQFSRMLTDLTLETAPNAEPWHEKNAPKKALIHAMATRQKPCFAIVSKHLINNEL